MRSKKIAPFLIGWLTALSLTATASAQSITGTIVGSVEDPGGLAVTGAEVTLVQTSKGGKRSTVTSGNGAFSFATVEPGGYTVTVKAEGFKMAQVNSLVLTASETLPVGTVRLEVGNVSQSVTVAAQGATVQTASSEHAALITGNQVENLLVRGRNVTDLMQLVPGVVTAARSSRHSAT